MRWPFVTAQPNTGGCPDTVPGTYTKGDCAMSTPEDSATDSNAENGPVTEFESTSLWPVDDPEKTSHIPRPAATAPAASAPAATEPPAEAPAAPAVDPEATVVASQFRGNHTQPWTSATPAAAPPAPAPGYSPPPTPTGYGQPGHYQQAPQPGGYPQAPGYQQAPGYPAGTGTGTYPPGPGYAHPQQPNQPTVGDSPTDNIDFSPNTKAAGRRRTLILIGSGVAVAAIAAVSVTGFWKPGFFITRQLNITKVTEGVQHILTDPNDGYGITGVSGLNCNNGQNPSGDQGTKFSCVLTVNGAKHNVEVTVVNDHGTYQVGKVT